MSQKWGIFPNIIDMATPSQRRAVPYLSVFVLATFFRLAAAPARRVEAEEVGSNREDLPVRRRA
jgi:hypothetical protein